MTPATADDSRTRVRDRRTAALHLETQRREKTARAGHFA